MDEPFDMGVMQGVMMYMTPVALLLFGGVAFWFGYRVFGTMLMIGMAALLAWVVAGRFVM
jgi:hypothetical protein